MPTPDSISGSSSDSGSDFSSDSSSEPRSDSRSDSRSESASGQTSALAEGEELQSREEFWQGILAFGLSLIIFTLLVIFVIVLGALVSGAGLHDPDTCWLLALGRYIVEHGWLPDTDPFSFTFQLVPGRHFIMYQWLSELIFYGWYLVSGLTGLLAFAATVLLFAFVILPMRLLARLGTPLWFATPIVLVGLSAACFHFLVRPEIFSYLCVSLWMGQVALMRTADDEVSRSQHVDWRRVAILFAIMVVWVNLHTGATTGFAVLGACILGSLIERVVLPDKRFYGRTAVAAFVASCLATVINPRGVDLVKYIPELFYPKVNSRIVELRPLGIKELTEFTYFPYYILCIVSLVFVFIVGRRWFAKKPLTAGFVVTPLMMIISIYLGFSCRRLIPFAVLVVTAQLGRLFQLMQQMDKHSDRQSEKQIQERNQEQHQEQPQELSQDQVQEQNREQNQEQNREASQQAAEPAMPVTFAKKLEARLRDRFDPHDKAWVGFMLALMLFGNLFISLKMFSPTLPQGSNVFHPPFEAVDYLSKNTPQGNGLENPQFGDMLIWYAHPVPKIFIDTRFDMYGDQIVADYERLAACRTGWQDLIKKYDIAWVFMHPDEPIIKQLRSDPRWTKSFEDDTAVVLKRTGAP